MFSFVFVAVLLVATFLLTPGPETPEAASLDDFNFPDNSIGKPIPRLYGLARLSGNFIYVGRLRSEKIEKCS